MSNTESFQNAEDALRGALDAEEGQAGRQPGTEPDTFSADYVRDLRREAANYRTQLRDYEKVWDGVPQEDRNVWENLAILTAENPQAGARELKRIAELMLGPESSPAPPVEPGAAPMTANTLTPDQIQQMIYEATQAASAQVTQQQLVHEVEVEAESLGYEVGSQDYIDLLWVADHVTNADLVAADKLIQDQRTQWVEDTIRERMEQSGFPKQFQGGLQPGERPKEIRTFEDAKASLEQRLNSW